MHIYLTGFMGSGKSAAGRRLSTLMELPFYDLDELFETRYKISIDDFFTKYGEDTFRKLEHELLISTLTIENSVIATGGGTPCFHGNMDIINQNGISVYLRLPPGMLASRILAAKKARPLLRNLDEETLKLKVTEMLNERERYYLQADIIFDAAGNDMSKLATAVKEKKMEKYREHQP